MTSISSPVLIILTDRDRAELEALARARKAPLRSVQRAWIILAAAAGDANAQIAGDLGLHVDTAKGLEFKQVLIPDIRREHTMTEPPTDDTERERWDLTRRELYVAMTRARDGLWVGIQN